MSELRSKLLIICCIWLRVTHGQFEDNFYKLLLQSNELETRQLQEEEEELQMDELDLSSVQWSRVIPLLLQREQMRLCLAVSRYDQSIVSGTACEPLLASGLMAYCDIGSIEDLSVTMRGAFGATLFDTLQKCRPGLELFGVRCRRRA